MRAARIAAGVLICLALPACGMFDKRKETAEKPRHVPPHLAMESGAPVTSPIAPGEQTQPQLRGGSYVPPPAGSANAYVLKDQDAIREIQSRRPAGGSVNSLHFEDGKMTVNTKYDDGSSMSIISDDKGNHVEYRPTR